ncbi:hypothetical protein [Yokenella regensburgei]|uniref:hypothetical protein n=1 Tax=Yokenella regensburgei TaxID=158877 RepID=UPI00143333ED|nr:hypothetical protein [Yokenella regensburgei]QIU92149.1 hypothetical protein HEC60_23885 [Yokenella regensburgei]
MPSTSPAINSFNAGEFSPLMMGQTDFQKWRSGSKKMLNFIPRSQGPAERRGGTYFVSEIKNSGNKAWLARFEYNTTQAFILEFGPSYIRFYSNHGVALDGSSNPLEISSPYTTDDLTNSDGGFGLSMVQSADVIYICTHAGNKPPYKLSRVSNTNWTMQPFDYAAANGPFDTINSDKSNTVYTDEFKIWSSDGATRPDGTPTTTHLCTITSALPIFSTGDVGGLFYIEAATDNTDNATVGYNGRILSWESQINYRPGQFTRSDGKYYEAMMAADTLTGSVQPTWTAGTHNDGSPGVPWRYSNGGWGVVQITSVTSPTVAVGKVVQELPPPVSSAVGKTYIWAFGEWSNTKGFPTKVSFYKSRLVFAGRNRIWFSVASDFENFTPMTDGYQVQSDDGINVQIEADSTNTIQWLASSSSLLIGTASSELSCSPSTTTSAFGADNIQITQESKYGSKGINSIIVGNTVLFVQRAGRKVRAVTSDYQSGTYNSLDLSVLAEHITSTGIVDFAWQQEPDCVVWVALASGGVVGLTYNSEQDVVAWHRHDFNGVVESVATIPDPTGNRDDLWVIVKRTINGETKRYVEYLHPSWDSYTESISNAFYVDSGLSYSGAPVTTISGLSHLEGKTVSILTDGATHPDRIVQSGSVSLDWTTSIAHVGLGFISELVTLPIEAGGTAGTAQSKIKRVSEMAIRFVNTLGGKSGVEGGNYLDVIPSRDYHDLMDQGPGPFTDDRKLVMPSQYDTNACLRVVQDQPLPMTVCAMYPRLWTSGE